MGPDNDPVAGPSGQSQMICCPPPGQAREGRGPGTPNGSKGPSAAPDLRQLETITRMAVGLGRALCHSARLPVLLA
eukprot:15455719-Alexandrium_andersonii.AAC.1